MISPTALFEFAVCLFVVGLAVMALPALRKVRRQADTPTLESLLSRLVAIDRCSLALVATEFEETSAEGLEPWQVWDLIGGLPGVERLAANCEVLIDLASYVQRWYPEALPVAEQLRLNAREIQWHVERLRGAESRGHLQTTFPDYAQRAVRIYYGMTQHVLNLFEVSQVPGFAQLSAAL